MNKVRITKLWIRWSEIREKLDRLKNRENHLWQEMQECVAELKKEKAL